MSVNLKLLMAKVKGSDLDASTVVMRVFLSRTFAFILSTNNSMIFRSMLPPIIVQINQSFCASSL